MIKLRRIILDIVFPERCLLCGQTLFLNSFENVPICRNCLSLIYPIEKRNRCVKCSKPLISEKKQCLRCRQNEFHFDRNISIFQYEGRIKELITHYKFEKRKRLSQLFSYFIAKYYFKYFREIPIVPAPYRPSAKRERGWDHVELISSILRKKYNIPVVELLKKHDTKEQKTLDFQMRKSNLAGKIFLSENHRLHSQVVLLDDILTTGATAEECTKVLLNSGINSVSVLTIALD